MNIELKGLKINNSFSEETICFMADLYVNGKKIAYAKNDGRGGCTFYSHYEGKRELLEQVEKFCKSLPKQKTDFGEFEQNLESYIDELVNNELIKKEQKKIEKLCDTHIVYGNPKGYSYKLIGFKGKPKLNELLKSENGKTALRNLIDRIKKELKDGEIIYNKNV